MHEVGHGLYSQGHPAAFARTFLFESPSLGAEESQARFFENHLGRHPAFLRIIHGMLAQRFGPVMDGISPDDLGRSVHHITRGWCRVDADEVTYDLHIALRLRMELALIRGELAVRDLPDAWREEMRRLLGVTPANDAQGCMQDIHWAWGLFGYFPTYTLGNLNAAQLFAAAKKQRKIASSIAKAEYEPLLQWLRAHIHERGGVLLPQQLIQDATGVPTDPKWHLRHLRERFL